jgi:hypothetical protein
MIRNLVVVIVVGAFVLASSTSAEARPRPRSSSFESNKTFGLGIMLGEPSGISGKYFMSADTAIDFGVGSYYGYRDHGLHVHADFLWHPAVIAKADAFWVPLYVGIGGRFLDHGNHGHVGARVPLGLALDFNNVPLDVFFELAAVLDIALNDDHSRLYGDVSASIGIRYWF